MRLYNIAELEQLSGIKAGTIRIWEKRFGIIEPWRTDTNIRMYDDGQVRKLLNVATLLSGGQKISQVAAISKKELHKEVEAVQACSGDARALSFINDLIAAIVAFDEELFHKAFDAAVAHYGMYNAMLEVCYPFLHKIGIMWVTENAVPVQEHFASALVRRKLLFAIEQLAVRKRGDKCFMLMLPPEEWHETGLLFTDYIIRSHGIKTVYLGQNVPYEHVQEVLYGTPVSHAFLLFTVPAGKDALISLRERMGLPASMPLLVAGNPSITARINKHKKTFRLDAPADLLPFLV